MSKNESTKDRRQHQRVLVEPSSKALSVEVVDHGKTLVFDMSYTGAAFAQPLEKKVDDVDQLVRLHLKTEIDEAVVQAKTIRVSDEVVAVEFQDISPTARVIIDRVVTDRIVGLNMTLIDPKHYAGKSDFSYWFHGPKETNLYFWIEGEELIKAQMEMDVAAMVFEDDMLLFENKDLGEGVATLNNQQIARKVHAIVEQMDGNLPALQQFKAMVKEHVQG